MKAPRPKTTTKTITLTARQIEAIGYALDLAHGDQEHLIKYGNPAADYDDEWPAVAQGKAADFVHLGQVGELLGYHGEKERWDQLAVDVLQSAAE